MPVPEWSRTTWSTTIRRRLARHLKDAESVLFAAGVH
jgi:hypothetical protein